MKRIKFLSLKKTNGRIFLKRELKKSAKQEKKKKAKNETQIQWPTINIQTLGKRHRE